MIIDCGHLFQPGRPFDFEGRGGGGGGGGGGVGDFRKKYPADCFRGKKNLALNTLNDV